jgi:hypothetical protein
MEYSVKNIGEKLFSQRKAVSSAQGGGDGWANDNFAVGECQNIGG